MTKLFSVLVICVIVLAHQTVAQETKGKDLITRVCQLAQKNSDLCVEVLSSDPKSANADDINDLAIIALRVVARNASAMLNDVKSMIDDANLDPEVQQGLADCKENILDAESQLEDTIAALLVESDVDSQKWLKAALAAITTCDNSIPGNDDVLSVKSRIFRRLTNIVVLITRALPKRTPSAQPVKV
uniref:Pectinesterase inhibitor domain-containing protein n=1 Tax=Medicago truncatula TaxID=3880 RepID=I3TAM7_MEDTR|nr:unknown [Medicago truncatula]